MTIPYKKPVDEALVWYPEFEIGYFPVDKHNHGNPFAAYDKDYFDRYKSYEGDSVANILNEYRISLASKYTQINTNILDIGIGGGTFVSKCGNSLGFDVNPAGVEWLKANDLWVDMYDPSAVQSNNISTFTFWDSLEHIPNIGEAIDAIPLTAIVSCPVYRSAEDILQSKHFRKDEHFWYWTGKGIIDLFTDFDFSCIAWEKGETLAGRESIDTFVFRRV